MQGFLYEFLGFGRIPSKCAITIISDDGDRFIFFENIGEGTSVTNASEQLATEIVNKFGYYPGDCRFFETYRENDYDTVEEIEYQWSGISNQDGSIKKNWEAKNASWKPASEEIVELFKNN